MDEITLRDRIAISVMQAEIQVWNSPMSSEHRAALLENMIEHHGKTLIKTAIALQSYEMADEMMKVRKLGKDKKSRNTG